MLFGVSAVEHPEEPKLRLFTVDDPRLWEPRPHLTPEQFALEGISDEEWDAFHAAIAER
jgi:hypothetical protein